MNEIQKALQLLRGDLSYDDIAEAREILDKVLAEDKEADHTAKLRLRFMMDLECKVARLQRQMDNPSPPTLDKDSFYMIDEENPIIKDDLALDCLKEMWVCMERALQDMEDNTRHCKDCGEVIQPLIDEYRRMIARSKDGELIYPDEE